MDKGLHEIHQSRAERFGVVFLCLLAFFCFCLGVCEWVRLVGIFPGENWRFDMMSWQWRSLSATQAVLYPVASCGLWLQSRWGVILWLLGAASDFCCFLLLAAWFSFNPLVPIIHFVFLITYIFVLLYRYHYSRTERETIAEY